MKKILAVLVVSLLLVPVSASGAPKLVRLGEDPALDAPPGLDITYLEAGRNGKDLEIRLGMENMLPAIGGYPVLPGVEWLFTTGKRTFLAEAYVDSTAPAFLLFEIKGDTYETIGDIEGTYDPADGYVSMLVPLKTIGAKKGTKISGAGEDDVDSHVHTLVGPTYYSDVMTTSGSIKL